MHSASCNRDDDFFGVSFQRKGAMFKDQSGPSSLNPMIILVEQIKTATIT
jgi:hypothetical protein